MEAPAYSSYRRRREDCDAGAVSSGAITVVNRPSKPSSNDFAAE
jgi:hypothetical protein